MLFVSKCQFNKFDTLFLFLISRQIKMTNYIFAIRNFKKNVTSKFY
jgi:hypothetical protein